MPTIAELTRSLRLPVVAAPMFLGSGPDLVVECCRAGIVGTFPALNLRTTDDFDAWVTEIETRLDEFRAEGQPRAPFGVNLIVHKSNARLAADLDVIVNHEVPVVITSLGAARDVVEAVHSYGGLVFHDVVNATFAAKARDAGADGLIAVSAGAGGHAGGTNPFALMTEIRQVWDGPVLLAGCLTSGADVLATQALGAQFAYVGTRFLASTEAIVSPEYKAMIVDSGPADIVYTPAISTVAANFLRGSIVAAGLDPENLGRPDAVDLTHLTNPHTEGTKSSDEGAEASKPAPGSRAWRDIWSAGQGVVGIDEVAPVADIVEAMAAEYDAARERLETTLRG